MSRYERPASDWAAAARVVVLYQDNVGDALAGTHFNGLADLIAEAIAAERRACATCGKSAACLGRYEMAAYYEFACDECCGHGNEDWRCHALEDDDAPRWFIEAMVAAGATVSA